MPYIVRMNVTPVKSLALTHPEEVKLVDVGIVENRQFYLVDEDGRIARIWRRVKVDGHAEDVLAAARGQ